MKRVVTVALTVALLAIVIAVFASPAVDLQPTALRVILWIVALFASLEVVRIGPSGVQELGSGKRIQARDQAIDFSSPSLVDLDCVRLC